MTRRFSFAAQSGAAPAFLRDARQGRDNGRHGRAASPAARPSRRRSPAAESQGQRADRFLAEAIGTLSRSRVKALIAEAWRRRDGDGRCASRPSRSAPAHLHAGLAAAVARSPPQPQDIPFTILYEDADLIVLDKPAGLVVHPAPAMRRHAGQRPAGPLRRHAPRHRRGEAAGIVHRLDKDTSGVMVVAKTERALARCPPPSPPATWTAHIWRWLGPAQPARRRDRGRHRPRPARPQAHGGGRARRQARAHPLPHASRLGRRLRLLDCRLATGRTHQIRVHLASARPPVVGDPVYLRRIPAAARALPEPVRQALLDFPRQALHAARLGFGHPITGQPLSSQCPAAGGYARRWSTYWMRDLQSKPDNWSVILDRTKSVLYTESRRARRVHCAGGDVRTRAASDGAGLRDVKVPSRTLDWFSRNPASSLRRNGQADSRTTKGASIGLCRH